MYFKDKYKVNWMKGRAKLIPGEIQKKTRQFKSETKENDGLILAKCLSSTAVPGSLCCRLVCNPGSLCGQHRCGLNTSAGTHGLQRRKKWLLLSKDLLI